MIKHVYIQPGKFPDPDETSGARGIVVGSEYCVHLLPTPEEFERYLLFVKERGMTLTLQLPILKDGDLKSVLPLLRAGCSLSDFRVIVSDWGALYVIAKMFPNVEPVIGRVLSGQKCCVRLEGSPFLKEAELGLLMRDISAVESFSYFLRDTFGVEKISVNYTGVVANYRGHLGRIFHYPYVLVTITDYCPVMGNRPSFRVEGCSRRCMMGVVSLSHESHRFPIFQRGKGKFFNPNRELEERMLWEAEVILYEDVP